MSQWQHTPVVTNPNLTDKLLTNVSPGEVRLKAQIYEASTNIAATRVTRVGAASSYFSGTVVMDGILLVAPQGGLDMGQYTQGKKPPSVEFGSAGQ